MLLFRYLSLELWKNFILVLLSLTGLLLLTRLVALLVELSSENLGYYDYLRLVLYLAPLFLTFILPLAALLASIFLFLCLSQDQELLAFESLGIPFVKLLKPVILLGLVSLLMTSFVTLKYLPWSKKAFRSFLFEITERKIEKGIPPKKFMSLIPGLSIFVEKAWGEGRRFAVVFMIDETSPRERGLIFARRGELLTRSGYIEFRLFEGSLHLASRDLQKIQEMEFEEYVYRLDVAKLERSRRRSRGEMSLAELKAMAARYPPGHKKRLYYLTEYYQRLAFPWAAFFLPLIGAPLGAMVKASGKGAAFFVAVFVYLVYYFLQSAGSSLAQAGILPPSLALFLPNIILGGLSLVLVWAFQKGKIGRGK
ncbi:MAG: YjgP/YjgQ family permease [Thermodesulfobacteria bacterium]|nr:YjgP/YjgQ family permease [Thermodesulfobacteriota bacterium]